MARRLLTVLILVAARLPAGADTDPQGWISGLSALVVEGVLANPDYAVAVRDLARALEDRRGDPAIRDSQLKLRRCLRPVPS